nr:MAG TPA: hypothetical protein [Caudoviricetes sp.]
MDILSYVLIAFGSLCVGILIGRISKCKQHGVFVMDDSENGERRWTLRLFVDPDDLPNGKNAIFKVIHETKGSCE